MAKLTWKKFILLELALIFVALVAYKAGQIYSDCRWHKSNVVWSCVDEYENKIEVVNKSPNNGIGTIVLARPASGECTMEVRENAR